MRYLVVFLLVGATSCARPVIVPTISPIPVLPAIPPPVSGTLDEPIEPEIPPCGKGDTIHYGQVESGWDKPCVRLAGAEKVRFKVTPYPRFSVKRQTDVRVTVIYDGPGDFIVAGLDGSGYSRNSGEELTRNQHVFYFRSVPEGYYLAFAQVYLRGNLVAQLAVRCCYGDIDPEAC